MATVIIVITDVMAAVLPWRSGPLRDENKHNLREQPLLDQTFRCQPGAQDGDAFLDFAWSRSR